MRDGDPQAASAALSDAVRPDAVRPDAVRPDVALPDVALPDAAACCNAPPAFPERYLKNPQVKVLQLGRAS